MNELPFNIRNTEQWLWFVVWFSLPISIKLNSLAILLAFLVFVVRAIRTPPSFKKQYLLYIVPLILYFLVQLIPLGDRLFNLSSWKEIEQQLPLLALPLLFMLSHTDKKEFAKTASSALFFSVFLASMVMISESSIRFFNAFDWEMFTYHSLSAPFDTGAIYFSFFIVFVLLRADAMLWLFKRQRVGIGAVSFLVMALFLLASKLIIITGILLILLKQRLFLIRFLKESPKRILILLALLLVLLVPFSQRFSKILNTDLDIVNNETYAYDSPLNGLNLRLIQFRFGFEILDQHHAWLRGVGMDQSQELLNKKYKEKGIYTGYEGTEDTGYLNYNFHNQYMETFIRSGALGLLSLLIILVVLIKTSRKNKFASSWEIGLILLFFVTESVLERQIGIVYFCMMYSAYFPFKLTK